VTFKKPIVLSNGQISQLQSSDYLEGQLMPVEKNHTNDEDTLLIDTCIFLDSSTSAFSLNLPSSPSAGDRIKFVDMTGSCNTNNVTLNRNSQKIMGVEDHLLVTIKYIYFTLIFSSAVNGWRIES